MQLRLIEDEFGAIAGADGKRLSLQVGRTEVVRWEGGYGRPQVPAEYETEWTTVEVEG